NILGDRVKDVRTSTRMTNSAACLVSDAGDVSPQMERVMRMLDREVETPKRILELNAKHPFVKNLSAMVEKSPDSEQVRTFSELLLDQAMLAEGVVPDPSSLLERMQQIMTVASEKSVKAS
ncbi:MAG: molecular chaperone HtpG, partial [Sorangium cellulosum]